MSDVAHKTVTVYKTDGSTESYRVEIADYASIDSTGGSLKLTGKYDTESTKKDWGIPFSQIKRWSVETVPAS